MSQDLHPAPALDIPESTEESGVRAWLRQKIWSSERRELALAWQSEADHVTRLILLRLRYPGDQPDQWGDVHLGSELEGIPPWQREFVYHRYASRIRWYAQAYPRLLRWHTGLALLVVAAGLASSGLAAINEGREDTSLGLSLAVITLGILVGVTTGLAQTWKPGQKSASYYAGQNDLRHEGWNFVQKRGPYKDLSYPNDAFTEFANAVTSLEQRALAIDLQGGGQPG